MVAMNDFTGRAEQDAVERAKRPFYWYTDGSCYIEAHTGPHAKKMRAQEELREHRGLCPECMQKLDNCVCS